MLQFVLDVFELSLYGFMAFSSQASSNTRFKPDIKYSFWKTRICQTDDMTSPSELGNAHQCMDTCHARPLENFHIRDLSYHVISALFFQYLADIFKSHFMFNFSPAIFLNWSNHQLYEKEHRILALLSLKVNYSKFSIILRRLKARPNSCFILFVPLKDSVHSSRSPGITCRQRTWLTWAMNTFSLTLTA